MLKTPIYYRPIGIAGNALVGKDTFCCTLINYFDLYHNISAQRCSIAGDFIRNDLKDIIFQKLNIDIDFHNPTQKTIIRPLMVEYGRFMRNSTEGRYFIEKLNKDKDFGLNFVPIIPDIRYCEFEKDELHWLKSEKNGILIFIEREGIKPANEFEEKNNQILKENSDFCLKIPNFKEMSDYYSYTKGITSNIITTYLQGTSQPLNKS